VNNGTLELWEHGSALLGLRRCTSCLLVEFLAGARPRRDLLEWLKTFGKPIEAHISNLKLERLMQRSGFVSLTRMMRYG
jgi:hypothetical protein